MRKLFAAFIGIADDATAVYHDLAAMSQLKGTNFFLGMDAIIPFLDYTPTIGGVSVKPAREFIPLPQGAVTHQILDRLTLGLGVFFPHGNDGNFKTASAIPSNAVEGRIFSMEIAPALTLELVEGLSVGASFRATRISSTLEGQIVAPLPLPAGFDTLNSLDVSGWGFGYSASAFFNRLKPISIDFNYRSEIEATLDGDVSFAALGNGNASLEQILPAQYDAEFDTPLAPGGTVNLPQNCRNSHTWMIGAELKPISPLAVRVGYSRDFDSSVPNSVNNRIIGDVAAHDVSLDLAYQ